MNWDFNKLPPFVQAYWYTAVTGTPRDPRVLVVHSMEAPEKGQTAENVANYFKNGCPDEHGNKRPASAHYCFDADSIVQCVQTKDVAYGAKGYNHHGIHLELAGYSRQARMEWLDTYSITMLKLCAKFCAVTLMPKFNIPATWLTDAQLIASQNDKHIRGFTTHAQITRAFNISGGHDDPGAGFPAREFMEFVAQAKQGKF